MLRLAPPLILVCAVALGCDAGTARSAEPPAETETDAEAPRHPFGAHDFTYAEGAALPAGDPEVLDAAAAVFYDDWKARYLVGGCGDDRLYVWTSDGERADPGGGQTGDSLTVSEAHGYGMIITALMAGYDPEAKALFDALYGFFRDHPAREAPDLMAWNQVVGCADGPEGGDESAADGDLDIAYALLLADAQWGSAGDIDYRGEAGRVLAAIAREEVHPDTGHVQLGSWVDPDEPALFDALRCSDFMPGHLRAFAALDPAWLDTLEAGYTLFLDVQDRLSPETGLLPDFLVDTPGVAEAAAPGFLEGDTDGAYAYNACRVPLRVAVDGLVSGEPRAARVAGRISAWFRQSTGGAPAAIGDAYALDGQHAWDEPDSTMAFIAPLAVASMLDPAEAEWRDALWTEVVERPLDAELYYGNTLKMLALIALSGNWFPPE